jgi:hypothetical protein
MSLMASSLTPSTWLARKFTAEVSAHMCVCVCVCVCAPTKGIRSSVHAHARTRTRTRVVAHAEGVEPVHDVIHAPCRGQQRHANARRRVLVCEHRSRFVRDRRRRAGLAHFLRHIVALRGMSERRWRTSVLVRFWMGSVLQSHQHGAEMRVNRVVERVDHLIECATVTGRRCAWISTKSGAPKGQKEHKCDIV